MAGTDHRGPRARRAAGDSACGRGGIDQGDPARGGGKARRGYLGVALHPVRLPERQRAAILGGDRGGSDRGVIVVGFTPDSPADRAGLLLGDVIVGAGGQPVNEIDDLHALLLSSRSMRRCRSTCCAARPR